MLTEKGAFRKGTCIGDDLYSDDGIPYGGFYTQDEIREVVSYAAERGGEVESLGIDRIRVVLADNYHADLLELVASDVAVKAEADSIDDVKKLMCYYRDFYRFLKNFVLFTDFYSCAPGVRANEPYQIFLTFFGF